jgi:hypothetical protein
MSEELWIPKPEDWYEAVLTMTAPNKGFIVGQLSNDESVWIHAKDITYGGTGKHHYCLPCDGSVAMSLRIERQEHSAFPYRAIECQIFADLKVTSREEGTVVYWRESYGSVRRPCGCTVFARQGKHDGGYFPVGAPIVIDVAFSEVRGDFVGEVVSDSEEFSGDKNVRNQKNHH